MTLRPRTLKIQASLRLKKIMSHLKIAKIWLVSSLRSTAGVAWMLTKHCNIHGSPSLSSKNKRASSWNTIKSCTRPNSKSERAKSWKTVKIATMFNPKSKRATSWLLIKSATTLSKDLKSSKARPLSRKRHWISWYRQPLRMRSKIFKHNSKPSIGMGLV